MFLCSRQIGSALAAADLVNDLKSVRDLRALVLPMAANRHWEATPRLKANMGARGRWLAQAMPQLRTLLYIDPQMSLCAALGEEPWREAMESICQSLSEADLGSMLVGRVVGDDLVERLETLLAAGCEFANTENGLPLRELGRPIQSMRVAMGAAPFVHAASEGCRVVLGGTASLGAVSLGFLHSDQTIDRRDWNALAQLTLHAMIAEETSLSIELSEEGVPSLHHAPWIPGEIQMETYVRERLKRLEAMFGPLRIRSPDVSFVEFTAEVQAGTYGGITLTGVRGGPPPPDLPVDIVYPAGHKSTLIASVVGHEGWNDLEQAARGLETKFPLTQGPDGREGIVTNWHDRAHQDPPARRLSVELFGPSESSVASKYGVAHELLAKVPGCSFHTAELPEVEIAYLRWPTTVPRELVEWDVEIRAASDWA